MIPKQLGHSPEPILELELHFEKFTKFAIFDNFVYGSGLGPFGAKNATQGHASRLTESRKIIF